MLEVGLLFYADYRHHFNIGSSNNSLFVQLAPGLAYTGTKLINVLFPMISDKQTTPTKPGEEAKDLSIFSGKIGAGYRLNFKGRTGLDFGVYCTIFAPTEKYAVIPSVGVTFHW